MASSFLDELLAAGEQADVITALLNAEFGAGMAEIDEVMKSAPAAVVLKGRFGGSPAVFKRFLTDRAPQIVDRMRQELGFLAQHLRTEEFGANRLLAALPEAGLAVLSLEPGDPVGGILKTAGPARRNEVLRLCGAWLSTVSALRRESRSLGMPRLMRPFEDLSFDPLSPEDRTLALNVLRQTRQFGESFAGMTAEFAIAHGDFAPVNLICDGRRICAVDIQGSSRLPLARTAARFLVAKDMYSARQAERRWGLDADDLRQFAPETILPGEEMTSSFVFFVGQQMLRHFVHSYPRKGGHPAARERLSQYLADLGAVQCN